MKIAEFLREDLVLANIASRDKAGALAELCGALARVHHLDEKKLEEVLHEREKLGSTGIGPGVAIPHGKLSAAQGLLAAFGRSVPGVDFQAVDGQPTHLFFVLIAPENSAGLHLKALARISRLFRNTVLRNAILEAPDAKAIFRLICEEDAKP